MRMRLVIVELVGAHHLGYFVYVSFGATQEPTVAGARRYQQAAMGENTEENT